MLKGFRQRHPALVRGTLIGIAFLFSFGSGLGYASWAMVCRSGRCPAPKLLDDYQPRQTSKLYAADGRFIAELGLEKRTLITLKDIPKVVQDAFVVTEDKRFWDHHGVDFQSIPRAVVTDIRAGSFVQGFSTITMQLARNIFPERISREKAPLRKLKEIKVAREIEARYDKNRILELYLNQINLGNGGYGVETASQRYFGKSVKDLNIAEAATLAALPKSPVYYNPRRYPEQAIQRRNTIVELMRAEGKITDAEANLARTYPLKLGTKEESGQVAPYFVEYIRQLLDEKFGKQLYEQGLKVYTTLDIDLELAAERALERQLKRIEAGQYGTYKHTSYEYYLSRNARKDETVESANSPYLQGSFIAMDPRTGAIRALVGGRDFDDNKFNRAVQALRQPGSTFKPFVYSAAIQNGRPLSYLLEDAPLAVPMGDGSEWKPQNYEGTYLGKVPMRQALYTSRNVPTIRLGMEIGEQSVIDMARRFGLTTPIPAYPSIFIGAAEVYPLEMVAAYSTFATLGTRAVPQAIVRVESAKGEILWEPEITRVPVMSAEEAWLMVSVMKDVLRRGTGARVGGEFSRPAGGKTGTTNDGFDVWFVGYTSDLVAGVWMGFDKPKKIKANAQGGQLAGPAWSAFMNEVYRRKPSPPDWPMPMNIVSRQIDVTTNQMASPYCPTAAVANEFFIPGTDPMYPCDVHTQFGLYPDTLGIYPPGTYQPGTYTPPRYDSITGRTILPPSSVPATRPVDSTRPRNLDSLVWTRPDTGRPRTVFPRDTIRRVRPDTLVRPDTFIRRPRPDTTRPRPDTTRPRTDTTRPRPDTTRPRPDTTRPRPDTTRVRSPTLR